MAPVVMEGTLTGIEPPSHLAPRAQPAMVWRQPGLEAGDVPLAFDLQVSAGGTLLTLTHSFPSGYDPRPYLVGWHEFMDAIEDGRSSGTRRNARCEPRIARRSAMPSWRRTAGSHAKVTPRRSPCCAGR